MACVAGIFDPWLRFSPDEKREMTAAMAQTMLHRARAGQHSIPLDDCRLALVHAGTAALHPDGRCVLAYDGEIRQVLRYTPQEREDPMQPAELLELFVREGADLFPRLDGSYAAVFYEAGGALHLARDPFGDKPLYYLEHNGVLAFASELRGLTVLPFFDPALDMDALAEFISFQYIGAPRSVYAQIRKLPPGHRLCCGQTGPASVHRFFAFTPGLPRSDQRPLPELAEELEEKLVRELRRRCFGRNEVHASLSGGVDSSTVAALAVHHLHVPVHTFSIGFSRTDETEHTAARRYAEILGTSHHERLMEPDACGFLQDIGSILDEPNGDSSCLPMFTLASFLSEHTDMALAGDYADELFGGYGRYPASLAELRAGQGASLGSRYYSNRILVFEESQVEDLLGCLPRAYADHLARLRAELDSAAWLHPLHRMRRSDMENYTPGAVASKADRMSMRHGVSMCSPFASLDVLRFAETLPPSALMDNGKGKLIVRHIAYTYLPARLIDAPKRGFGLPMGGWGAARLLSMAQNLLASPDSQLAAVISPKKLRAFLDKQQRSFSTYQVWALCVLESFLRHNRASPGSMPRTAGGARWLPLDRALRTQAFQHVMTTLTKPLLAFISDPDQIFKLSTELSTARVLYVYKKDLPDSVSGIVLDWENTRDWTPLRPHVPPEAIACFPKGALPLPWQNRQIRALGVQRTLVFEEDAAYVVTTRTASRRERLAAMWSLARLRTRRASV